MEILKERRLRIVLVPCPLQGHITPMLELAAILHSNGFSITIAHTIFNAPNPLNHPDFDFLPLFDNIPNPDTSPQNLMSLGKSINANCEAPFKKSMAQMMQVNSTGDQIVCIIYDILMPFAEAVASSMNLPSIILQTAAASYVLACDSIPQLHAQGFFPAKDNMLHDIVPRLHPVRFKDLSFSNIASLEDILQMVADSRNTRTSSAIIWNTIDHLQRSSLLQLQRNYKVPFFSVGPLYRMAHISSTSLLKEDTSCITWLDKQVPHSVIYISLGSLAMIDEKELAEMALGIAASGQPFLWVVRDGSVRGTKWTNSLPEGFEEETKERGLVVKWAPQREVLGHGCVGGFWSHCGWNSVLESVSEGVPMICMPSFGDQKVNARYVSDEWRVGLVYEGEVERGEIARSVKRLMVDKEGKEIREKAIRLKDKVELSVRKGGDSYNALNALVEFILK